MTCGRVLVVEDEQFTRTMISATLTGLGFDVVAACGTALPALEVARAGIVDVALLDLDLGPGPSGIDIAHALRALQSAIGIVLLTSFSDPRVMDPRERRLPRGSRYLVKGELDQVDRLRDSLLAVVRDPLRETTRSQPESGLTRHQVSVLRQLAAGRTNAQIATELDVTEKAVERTVQRIGTALGLERDSGNQRVLLARAYAELSGKQPPGADA